MEPVQDLGLGLAGEVHERVATHEKIDARDRRILDEIVASEDDRAADVLVEEIPVVDALEVLREELRRDVLHLRCAIGSVARLHQRVLVDVRGVDLHPPAERLDPEMLGQDHGERVGLLARRAAGAPDSDGAVGPAAGQDAREDLRRQVSPRLRITKEARDVDENGVEEQAELLGVRREVGLIRVVRLDADRLQALLDTAHEARPLVGGEIEAAGALQIVEQSLEPVVIRVHRPLRSSPG